MQCNEIEGSNKTLISLKLHQGYKLAVNFIARFTFDLVSF
jgi:hypothetical protein